MPLALIDRLIGIILYLEGLMSVCYADLLSFMLFRDPVLYVLVVLSVLESNFNYPPCHSVSSGICLRVL